MIWMNAFEENYKVKTNQYCLKCLNDITPTDWQNGSMKYILIYPRFYKPAKLQKKVSNSSGRMSIHSIKKNDWADYLSSKFIIEINVAKWYILTTRRHEEKMCIDKMSNFSGLISSVFLIGFLSILNPCFVTSVKGKIC